MYVFFLFGNPAAPNRWTGLAQKLCFESDNVWYILARKISPQNPNINFYNTTIDHTIDIVQGFGFNNILSTIARHLLTYSYTKKGVEW